jgi:ankyrin repeat protein
MLYSLVSVKPNIDYPLDQHYGQVKCNDHTATITFNPELASADINIDGIVKTITKDAGFKVGDARFTVKFEDGKCIFFPQSDGMQAQSEFTNSLVHQCVQNNVRDAMTAINRVSELEQSEARLNASAIEGYNARDAAQGYALICQLYLITHFKGLSKTEKDELTRAYQTLVSLSQLADDTAPLYTEYFQFLRNNPNWYDALGKSPASAQLATISHELAGKLLQENSVFINYGLKGDIAGGSHGHHEVIKITFSGNTETGIGKYNYIIYNAGYESELVNSEKGIVTGIREYELNCQNRNEIERFILLAHERLMRSDQGATKTKFDKISKEVEKYVIKRIRADQKPEQKRGNCTTMSTRLALEDMMTPELFRKLYKFVSNTQQILQVLSTPLVPDSPTSPTSPVTKSKVNPNIARLAQQLAGSSKLFQGSGVSIAIQEAINRGNSTSIVPLLKDEKSKSKSNYLAGVSQEDSLTQQYNFSSGKTGTLLHYAVTMGNKDIAAYCLESGMTGLEKDGAGYPALHTAIILGQNEITQMIIQAQKNPQILATTANDGVTAVKLALECDRMTTVAALIEKGADLSPEKNNNFVIFNLLVEKALFSNEANEYLVLLNNIIKNPEKNRVDLNARDGNKENALDIFQGLFSTPISEANQKKLTPELLHFVNELIVNDLESKDIKHMYEKHPLTNTLPYMEQDVFEKLFKSLKDSYAASEDKYSHYFNLTDGVLEINDLDKMKFLLDQQLIDDIYTGLFARMRLEPVAKGMPFSRDMLALIVGKTEFLSEKRIETLKMRLAQYIPAAEVAEMIKHIKIKVKPDAPVESDKAEAALLEIQQRNKEYNAAIRIRFVERQQAYYKFGDITRSIIKFITGFDVVRENALFNTEQTLPKVVTAAYSNYHFGDISRSLWSAVSSLVISPPEKTKENESNSLPGKKNNKQ